MSSPAPVQAACPPRRRGFVSSVRGFPPRDHVQRITLYHTSFSARMQALSSAAALPYIRRSGRGVSFREMRPAEKLFRAQVLTTGQDLAIMYPLLLKAANCICGSAGIGRQARLRGVCCMTYGFKSHLPHHAGSPAFAGLFVFSSDFLKNAVQYTPSQGGDCPDQTNIVPQKLTRCRCVNFLSLHRFPICRSSFSASLESGSQPCSTALLQGGL